MSIGMKKAIQFLLITSLLITQAGVINAQTDSTENIEEVFISEGSSKVINEARINLKDQTAMLNGEVLDEKTEVVYEEGTYWLPARILTSKLLAAYVSLEDEGKTLRIKREETSVQISLEKQAAFINGEEKSLLKKVYIHNGVFMVAAEDLEALFQIEVTLDGECLIVKGEDKRSNTAPEADFYFMKNQYVEGQEVVAVNISRDQDEDKIKACRWSVGRENPQVSDELAKIFKKPKAGTHVIGLQVQDERGLWSEWVYKKIEVIGNKAPDLQAVVSTKESYAPGEMLELSYLCSNEEWESITNEKWMYRKSTEAENMAVLGKPKAFFTEGEYIISLQVDDALGQRSQKQEITIQIAGDKVRSELEYHFTQSSIGERIDNYDAYNFRQYEDAVIEETTLVPGTLIMSDSPETVKDFGVLYEDTINGNGRILIHHLNQINEETADGKKQKLVLAAVNDSDQPVTFTLKNESVKGPATDITRVGQRVVYDYLAGNRSRVVTLEPGEKQWIYSQNWTVNGCISGMMDIETEDEIRFIIAAVTEETSLEDIENLSRQPADGIHMSGKFDLVGIEYKLSLDGGVPTKLMLGDKGSEEWLTGTDSRTETAIQNKGNFGVTYYVTVTAGEDMGILLNSRGSGIQGAIKWQEEGVYNIPVQGILAQTTTRAVVLGTLKKGETKTFEYILPNGSSAPILIGFVPKSSW